MHPSEPCYWITFLAQALPLRSVGSFIELLVGSILISTGSSIDAYLMAQAGDHRDGYYNGYKRVNGPSQV